MARKLLVRAGSSAARALVAARTFSTGSGVDFDKIVERRFTGALKYDRYCRDRDSPAASYRDIIPLWVADMDFEAPPPLVRALAERVSNHCIYGYPGPDWAVKSTVISYLSRRHGVEASSEQLVMLPGLVVGLNVIGLMAKSKGEAIMTASPVYPPFMSAPKNSGTSSVAVALRWCDRISHFTFDFDAMEQAVEACPQRVGTFLLCNPHNPVGRVFTAAELQELVRFCERHSMMICSDEVHCDLILDESVEHTPLLGLATDASDCAARRSITFHAPSKTYNCAGLFAAFAVIPDLQVRGAFKRATRGIVADVNTLGYTALQTCYSECVETESWRQELLRYLRGNIELTRKHVQSMGPFIKWGHQQQATYLIWLDASSLEERVGTNAAKWLEDEAGVGLNDGSLFGPPNEYRGYIRMNLACPRSTLEAALGRISTAIAKL
jgi:cystathionine beta-lyase